MGRWLVTACRMLHAWGALHACNALRRVTPAHGPKQQRRPALSAHLEPGISLM
jgi:hypothetical protein